MRNFGIILILSLIPTQVFAQRQAEWPRVKFTFDGSTTVETADVDGFLLWRQSSVTPTVSSAGTAKIYFDGTNIRISENGAAFRIIGAGNGTVTSVGLSLPASIFTVTNSPVTVSGTLTGTFVNQTANTFFAGPASGAAAAPTFRAFVDADVPVRTINITKLAQSGCTTGAPIEWGTTDWICGIDETTPGGNAWFTNGNPLGAATATLGSTDAFDWNIIRGGTNILTVGAAAVTLVGGVDIIGTVGTQVDLSATTGTGHAVSTGSQAGLSTAFITSTRSTAPPVSGGNEGRIYFDSVDDKFKISENGSAYTNLFYTAPSQIITLERWRPNDAEQPATNFPNFGIRNNHPILSYDAATDEIAYFTGVVNEQYDDTTSVVVEISWTSATATTGNVVWRAAIEMMDTSTDIDADSFGTEISVTQTTLSISGQVRQATATFTRAQADTITRGLPFRVRLARDADNAGDTMAGDAQLVAVALRYTRP